MDGLWWEPLVKQCTSYSGRYAIQDNRQVKPKDNPKCHHIGNATKAQNVYQRHVSACVYRMKRL